MLSSPENIQTTEEWIAQLSEATGKSFEIVGDILLRTMRTFYKEIGETYLLADQLVAVISSTNTSILGLGESLAFVGPIAALMNQPLDDVLILLGLLGDAGIEGSMAGIGLMAVLNRLQVTSAAAEPESIKRTFDIVSASAKNSDGSMRSVLEILPELRGSIGKLWQAEQGILMEALFGVEGAPVFQALFNTTPEHVAIVTSRVKSAGR